MMQSNLLRLHCPIKHVNFSIQIFQEDVELPKGLTNFARNGLSLEGEGSDGDQLPVAFHALIVPVKRRRNSSLTLLN